MNIFVTDLCPIKSALVLPDKHIVKMPLETTQMLSIIASKWYLNLGDIPKKSGGFYNTAKGAFRNHPCTVWAASNINNWSWLLAHGINLCKEYTMRYGKEHACEYSLNYCLKLFPLGNSFEAKDFARAMPDDIKNNTEITTFEAYRECLRRKEWPKNNFIRKPDRKPQWLT